jgi:hypothetical protein
MRGDASAGPLSPLIGLAVPQLGIGTAMGCLLAQSRDRPAAPVTTF